MSEKTAAGASDRKDLVGVVCRTLKSDTEECRHELAEAVVQAITTAADADGGWLIRNGRVRRVEIADRFGPSSWEVDTEQLPGDLEDWNNPDRRDST